MLLAAALMLPVIAYAAYAATTTANLSIVVTSGVSPPAVAASAGYTTLAWDDDFTKPQPDQWLGGCSNPGNGAFTNPTYFDDGGPHRWWMNIWWSAGYQPCNVGPITDPTYGGTVLNIPWIVDNAYSAVGTVIETASWDRNPVTGAGKANTFPKGVYLEVVSRMVPHNVEGAYMILHTWGEYGVSNQSRPDIEWDVMETSDSRRLDYFDTAVHNWGNGGGVIFICGPDCWVSLAPGTNYNPANYNTYGMLITYDESAATATGCSYINNVFQRCGAAPGGVSSLEAVDRSFLVMYTACDWWHYSSCNQGQHQAMLVKSVRVWSCANWQTTQCATGSTPPGPNVLTGGASMTSGWTATDATLQTNAATDPTGATGAAILKEGTDSVAANHYVQQTFTAPGGQLRTASIYIHQGSVTNRGVGINISNSGGTNQVQHSVTSSCATTTAGNYQTGNGSVVSSGSQTLGNGWCRMWFVYSFPASPTQFQVLIRDATNDTGNYIGNGTGNIQIYGPVDNLGTSPGTP